MIDILAERGILNLTFTGGEPLIIGKEKLFNMIKYAHDKFIHTTLSTTGILHSKNKDNEEGNLTKHDIDYLDNYLDHFLLSVDCVCEQIAKNIYRNTDDWKGMMKKCEDILKWCSEGDIIVEICTVVTAKNIANVIETGKWLFERKLNIFWRIDEYYSSGNQESTDERKIFELDSHQFDDLRKKIETDIFFSSIEKKRIRFNTKESRWSASDIMISPSGNIVTSSNNSYNVVGDRNYLYFWKFKNRRPYNDYKNYCRNWEWESQFDI